MVRFRSVLLLSDEISHIWVRYISTGGGNGNPYGLAAVFAVCFPFFFYARLYWPGAPMTNIIFFVTTMLVGKLLDNYLSSILTMPQVVGYSYQDNYFLLPGNPGFGIEVAWVYSSSSVHL